MDYRTYRLNKKELILLCGEAAVLAGVVAFCFYDSFWALGICLLFLPFYLKKKKQELAKKRRKALKLQFKDTVQSLAAALAAGYSVENALREAQKDLRLIYAPGEVIIQELAAMQRKLSANQSMETIVLDFAERSGLEEARTFAEIFATARRGGGDLIGIMKNTARTIAETVETEREIGAVLAARRYEQKIMSRIPFAMILYLRIGAGGFLEPLYHNVVGICIMTVCLGIYLTAGYLGRKMLEIEV